MTHTDGRSIAFMNQKGGVGKTTTTVNLAAAAARRGMPTLVIDLDPQAHATLHLGVEPEAEGVVTVRDVLHDPARAGEACRPVGDRLWLMPSETSLAGVENELAGVPGAQTRLRDALAGISGRFACVMLDCPPSLGLLTVAGLCAAREVIIPMQAHFLALQGVGKLLETVAALRGGAGHVGLNPTLRVAGVVLCMHDRQATHTQEVVSDLRAFFDEASRGPQTGWSGACVFEPPVRRNIKLAECPSFGQTIFEYAPDAAGAADYDALAASVFGEEPREGVVEVVRAAPHAVHHDALG